MSFVTGGDVALSALQETSFDIVVTDLRMPRVGGLALLKYLREQHPQTIRIVLSGDTELDSALAVIPYAHQSLTKPCHVGELESVLERACVLGDLVADPDVRAVIGGLGELPPLQGTYARLAAVLDDEDSRASDVATVISSDLAVTAKLLQLANSAFFGARRPVATVLDSIPLLGFDTVRNVTLSTALFGAFGQSARVRTFAEDLHEHSGLIASLAWRLAAPGKRSDAFAAGLLHDIGRLILASTMPDGASSTQPSPTRHAKVGAYLLGLWGLPPVVMEAVARHHDEIDPSTSVVTRAVNRAERIAESVTDALRPSAREVEEMTKRVDEEKRGSHVSCDAAPLKERAS